MGFPQRRSNSLNRIGTDAARPSMQEKILQFLKALDDTLAEYAKPGARLDLYHIGRSAVVFHYGAAAVSTKDFDIVQMETSGKPDSLEAKAITLFGLNTENAGKLGLYLDLVPAGLPPVPQNFRGRCVEAPGNWNVIRLLRPEVHDLAAMKIKSFRPKDRQDLQFLSDEGLLDPDKLAASCESAYTWFADEDKEQPLANLDQVIRYIDGETTTL